MADDITLPGTGTVVAAADKSSVYYQKVQLDIGGAGGFIAAIGDSAGAIYVRPTPNMFRILVTPTITTTPYTAGDCLGGLQTISNAARVSGGSGFIECITVLDRSQLQRAAIDLVFFDRSVTVAGDNSAFACTDADMANCLGVISIGPYNVAWPGTPANSISTLINVGFPFDCNATDLFVQPIIRATPTYAVGDLTFGYIVLQN